MATPKHSIQIILSHPGAPSKPTLGAACNGCGVCCLLAPCPLGVVLSGRRKGACTALRWRDGAGEYRCGAVVAAREVVDAALPKAWSWLALPLAWLLERLARRWIAVGIGCDSSVESEPSATMRTPSSGYDHD